ncbi:MAG: Rrf2 family transcriptional regulator [Candidatus Abyssobacteria bacterium SURF_17]|jgi:Rrf2 family protein|uniref:Rrf2 family transcriptional regulator n=1 Tax=Candidatus Abyssobacteria bacterium SURF_17 TaxID=2093361 RepID=A0A419ERW6_9BACT|nr:MAG: Rrf2 family transcriptional regulator [Candidatus Abyssubacteria bacterium SURF_17]
MKFFSKGSEYAIRAMLHVAESHSFDGFSPKKICAEAGIPEPFGRKAFAELVKAQIIQGTRGPGGGYNLMRDPADTSLLDIVLAVDGQHSFDDCPMGLQCEAQKAGGSFRACKNCRIPKPKCGLNHVCPMHSLWKQTRQSVIHYLETTTLEDIKDRLIAASSRKDISA